MTTQAELHSRAKDIRRDPLVVYARLFTRLTHHFLQERRDAGLPVSSAHSEAHLRGVSDLIPAIGQAYGFSEREVLLGRFAGQFHDIVRSGREDLGTHDEVVSAAKSESVLTDLNESGQFSTTPEERAAVSFAILNHGRPPAFFKDPQTREQTPENLDDRIHVMLYVADGLQKLGAPLIHRRSSFVGGERRFEGDLKDMRFEGRPIDVIHAILLESAVRLGWKNVEGLYPKRLRTFIEPAFRIQRDWVAGLLAGSRMQMADWAYFLMTTVNDKGQNIFQIAGLPDAPISPNEVKGVLQSVGGIDDEVIDTAARDRDLVNSSMEAATYFAGNYQQDPPENIRRWKPTGARAKEWKKGM